MDDIYADFADIIDTAFSKEAPVCQAGWCRVKMPVVVSLSFRCTVCTFRTFLDCCQFCDRLLSASTNTVMAHDNCTNTQFRLEYRVMAGACDEL